MTESAERSWVLVFNGRTVPATPGDSVGAALTNAGIRSWRLTRKLGRPRGLFCGIGVCFDCLLTIDGLPNQRACLTPVAPGMQVESGSWTEQELTDA
jgi:predicted molibdopterin-dependent oxidoreductase YjgC